MAPHALAPASSAAAASSLLDAHFTDASVVGDTSSVAAMRAYVAFATFAQARQWPPDTLSLRRFTAYLGSCGYAANTITSYVSGVQTTAVRRLELAAPISDIARTAAIKHISLRPGQGARPAVALSSIVLNAMMLTLTCSDAVYAAMCLVQLFTLARSEAVAWQAKYGGLKVIRLCDIRRDPASTGLLVLLRNGKYAAGTQTWELIPAVPGSPLCLVNAIGRYLVHRVDSAHDAPFFTDGAGTPIEYNAYLRWVKNAATAAGAGPITIGTNSLRRSAVALLEDLSVSAADLNAAGRWVSIPKTYKLKATPRKRMRAAIATAFGNRMSFGV